MSPAFVEKRLSSTVSSHGFTFNVDSPVTIHLDRGPGICTLLYISSMLHTLTIVVSVLPIPIDQYRDSNRSWVLPLQFVFSMAWALEM